MSSRFDFRCLDNGPLVIIGGVLLYLILGCLYMWGTINIYACSFMILNGDPSATLPNLFVIIPISEIVTAMFLPLGTTLARNYNPKWVIGIGGSIVILGFFCCSFTQNAALFAFLYGGFHGIGNGLSYMVPVQCAWNYYPKNRGLAGGFIISAFGVGAFIFSQISTHIINPSNKDPSVKVQRGQVQDYYYDRQIADRFPSTMRYLCIAWVSLLVLAIILIRNPGQRWRQDSTQSSNNPQKSVGSELQMFLTSNQHNTGMPIKQAIKTFLFWHLYILLFLSIFYGVFIVSVAKPLGVAENKDDHFNTTVVSVAAVLGGGLRFIWSGAMDKFSFKSIFLVNLILQSVICATIMQVASNKALYLIWVSLSLICEGACFSMFPTMCSTTFGLKTGSQIFGVMFSSIGFSAVLGFLLNKYVVGLISYSTFFYIITGVNILAILLLLCLKTTKYSKKSPDSANQEGASHMEY